jgi:hypothetical protein
MVPEVSVYHDEEHVVEQSSSHPGSQEADRERILLLFLFPPDPHNPL